MTNTDVCVAWTDANSNLLYVRGPSEPQVIATKAAFPALASDHAGRAACVFESAGHCRVLILPAAP
jgi:hypothetical protein